MMGEYVYILTNNPTLFLIILIQMHTIPQSNRTCFRDSDAKQYNCQLFTEIWSQPETWNKPASIFKIV